MASSHVQLWHLFSMSTSIRKLKPLNVYEKWAHVHTMLTEYLKKSSLKPDYLTIFTSFAFLICPYSAAFNLQTLSSKGHRKLGNSDWEIKLGQCKNGKFFSLSSNTYGLRLIVIHGQKVLESSHHCIWSNKRILHSAMGTFSSTSTKN